MGDKLTRYLPRLYHTGSNDIYDFLAALEPSIDYIEGKYAALPDLINVDKCPEKYLAYLAANTGVPLIGEDSAQWRRQIKAWPYVLRKKGTESSIRLLLESINFARILVFTYWRDAEGNYVTDKPEGEPFKGSDGVWYNSRTHYFSLELYRPNGELLPTDAMDTVKALLPKVKPHHAELLEYILVTTFFEGEEILVEGCDTLKIDHRNICTEIYPWPDVNSGGLKYNGAQKYDGSYYYHDDMGDTEIIHLQTQNIVSENVGDETEEDVEISVKRVAKYNGQCTYSGTYEGQALKYGGNITY